VQHVQDPVERQPIINRLTTGIATTTLTHRDQRLDLRPQLITDLESRRHLHDLQSSGTPPQDSRPEPQPLHFESTSKDLYTPTRVAIVLAWPLLTAIGLLGYRRYRERRYREARVALATYSLTGLATAGHFLYGNPKIPAFFYATLFTDVLTALSVLVFLAWSARTVEPRLQSARA
jgi:hypothetical protein